MQVSAKQQTKPPAAVVELTVMCETDGTTTSQLLGRNIATVKREHVLLWHRSTHSYF